ncbi:MAG: oxidoreductase [Acidobacteriota bacterium]|nr:oxidoreductase [Acidobacteriota bacterium]
MPDLLTLRLRESVAATPRARILRIDLAHHRFPFQAGQAVLAGRHGGPRRPYSIAVAPEDVRQTGCLELLVQTEEDGTLPDHLGVDPGSLIDVEGPIGSFRFPDHPMERAVLFIAGGTGIAPLRSMLRHVLATQPGLDVSLLYSARTPAEFAYEDELRALAARGRIELHQTVTREMPEGWTRARGRIDREALAGLVHAPETLCFLCGPPGLIETLPPILTGLGVAPIRIRMEEWG